MNEGPEAVPLRQCVWMGSKLSFHSKALLWWRDVVVRG